MSACPFTGRASRQKLDACEASSTKSSLHLGLSVAELAFALLVLRRVIALHQMTYAALSELCCSTLKVVEAAFPCLPVEHSPWAAVTQER